MKSKEINKPIVAYVILSLLFVGALSYHTGYSKGTTDTIFTVAELAPNMLDIELTDKAKSLLISNPRIVFQVLTPESLEKLYSDLNYSATAKGGIGASWNVDINISNVN